jgi:hypothetical protein
MNTDRTVVTLACVTILANEVGHAGLPTHLESTAPAFPAQTRPVITTTSTSSAANADALWQIRGLFTDRF